MKKIGNGGPVTREACIAVNRFGLGAQPDEVARAAPDPRGWLLAQAKAAPPRYPEFDGLMASPEALKVFPRFARRILRQSGASRRELNAAMPKDAGVEAKFKEVFLPILTAETGARMRVATRTKVPFQERLVWFWANHFTVSGAKPAVLAVAGPFEREAIRPYINGRFVDLLTAATRHPAMIVYLDNHLSVAPGRQARGFGQKLTGLNENLAREILELHTLGVDGGYTQSDVTTFARVLTGWTVGNPWKPGFVFEAQRHDSGEKTLLGRTYRQSGRAQGEAVLRDLAANPATARHLAFKLARHFIADEPPPSAVDRMAKAYLDSGGALPALYKALVDSPEAWSQPLGKVKQPVEFIASAMRALPAIQEAKDEALLFSLNELGQRTYFAPSPQGWPDVADAWIGPDAVWKRIEWASTVAGRLGQSVDPLALARDSYGELLSERTATAIARAESRQQGLALWLASPEFQRR
jgi:uncharacterized protein (DUF1800 family)